MVGEPRQEEAEDREHDAEDDDGGDQHRALLRCRRGGSQLLLDLVGFLAVPAGPLALALAERPGSLRLLGQLVGAAALLLGHARVPLRLLGRLRGLRLLGLLLLGVAARLGGAGLGLVAV